MENYFYMITDGVAIAHLHGKWMRKGCPKGWRVIGVYQA